MKTLFFVLTILLSFGVQAASISGEVTYIQGSGFAILTSGECGRYRMTSEVSETAKILRRFAEGDTISGTGTLNEATCTAHIDSVEYVGLKRLLGYWYGKAGTMAVTDFSNLNFYPLETSDLNSQTAIIPKDPISYKYSVTPSEGAEWVLFLSDKHGTSFATIEFRNNRAILKLYDSETGQLTQTLILTKWAEITL